MTRPRRVVAVSETMLVPPSVVHLRERADPADGKILGRLLKRVPDVPALAGDELPESQLGNPAQSAHRASSV